jgi:hypothetical protein
MGRLRKVMAMSRAGMDDGWRQATGRQDPEKVNLAWVPRRLVHMAGEPPQGIGGILKPGVYLLALREKIVFVGRSKCMLAAIAGHRSVAIGPRMPEWFPLKGILFDDAFIYPMSFDQTLPLMNALIEFHKPAHNAHDKPATVLPIKPPPQITRRA